MGGLCVGEIDLKTLHKNKMKKILFFLTCILFCVKLTAQENDSLSRFSIAELDSLFKIQKKPVEQLPYALAILKKGEKELDNSDTAFAKILFKAGDTYQKLRDWPNATNYLEKAIAIWQEKMPLNPGHANCLHSLGNLWYYLGKYEDTKKYWQLCFETRKKVLGEEHPDYARSLGNLGVLYYQMGDYESAELYYKQTLAITMKIMGKEHPNYAASLNNLGVLYNDMGDYKSAETYYKQALVIKKIVLGESHPEYVGSLHNLGALYYKMGDYKSAETYYKQAMSIRKSVLGEMHPDYASSLNNLGTLYFKNGDYKSTESYYKQALSIRKNVLGESHPDYARSLHDLGLLYRIMGDYKSAETYYKQTLSIQKSVLDESHPDYALTLNNLGLLYSEMGDCNSAEPYHKQALAIRKSVLGEMHPDYATGIDNLGVLYRDMGDYQSAETYLKQSLAIRKSVLGESHPDYAISLSNLGALHMSRRDYQSAELCYKQALAIRKSVLGEMHPDYATGLENLGVLYKKMGDYKLAEVYYNDCFAIKNSNLSNNFSWLPEKGKEAYWQLEKSFYQNLNNFVAKAEYYTKTAELAYNGNLIANGLLLESTKEIEDAVLNNKDSTTQKVYEELKSLKRLVNHLVSTDSGKKDIIEKYENEADSLDKILVSRLGEYAAFKRKFQLIWRDVQNALIDNEAAIEFARYTNEKDSQNYYMALVLKKGFEYPKLVKLGSEQEIVSISAASGFSELYKLIWEPLDSLMEGVKTVYYSPTGYLNNISFAVLCGKGTEEIVASTDKRRGSITKNITKTRNCVYLADRFTLHQLSTTRYLAEGLKDSKPDNSILVFGGVNYDLIPTSKDSVAEAGSEDFTMIENISRSSANQNKMEYLHGTKIESENLQKILSKKKWKVKAYTEVNASENNFKSELNNKTSSVIHIATHGFAFPEPEEKKKSQFEENNRPYRDSDNPMARCGLLLAGANNSWLGNADTMLTKSGEDGILSALEVSQLNLRKTKLVVLSACETGLGKIEGSEGTFGLKRGFKLAGVEQIIVSLWSVPDKETMELMTLFYNDLSVTLNPVTSFEKAQKEMRKKYPTEPEKWAGFVLVR
jgi:tetratricopeptide (TPR) repeat protein